MRPVTKFEADDGTVFDTELEAVCHDRLNEIGDIYERNKLYGPREGCRIDWDDFLEWVKENRNLVNEILKVI